MPFKTSYQEFIYKRTYARWIEDFGRREAWQETTRRYRDFFMSKVDKSKMTPEQALDLVDAFFAINNLEVMPSMRALWTSGEALERENIAGYNCAYTVIDSVKSFAEILYILMNGTGVGFSVERQYINHLPEVPEELKDASNDFVIKFEDSKMGWAEGYHRLLINLFHGYIWKLDYSLIRPKGSRLKTFGGRASGHEPLQQLCEFTIDTFKKAQGRKLNSLECYDLVCMIANCVVVGGVRRSATINLSNFSDQRMRHAKDGQFWLENPQRFLSNNSVAYTEKPDMVAFMEEWLNLSRSGTGERGIVNRQGFQRTAKEQGREVRDFGVNPCGEIVLRPKQFCNLTEVVVTAEDTLATLKKKVKYATILGCLQSTLSNFGFLDEEWKKNTEEERLLGVSLTGLADHRVLNGSMGMTKLMESLQQMKDVAHETAQEWSKILGINVPKAVTCVKPSGTVSQLVDSSSGIHPRFSRFYIRRVRVNAHDPISTFMIDKGMSWEPEVGESRINCNTKVFSFPIEAPEGCLTKDKVTALGQLQYWLILKEHWCDHNPSATIYVDNHEWLEVGAWVYKNWDSIGGLSFLPKAGGNYEQAPYEEINEDTYLKMKLELPSLDFNMITKYEHQDQTQGAREFACVGGSCEL